MVSERSLVVSTPESPLWQLAEQKSIQSFRWEGDIGGRFSAFTVAHTLILTILGLDTEAFLLGKEGAKVAEAKHLAAEIFENYKKEFTILDFFIFNSELEDVGKWSRQLIAESLALLTPTVSLGPTDLHSMLELYLGGPEVRFTIFVRSLKEIDETINEATYDKVVSAYKEGGLPFATYEIEEINEKSIGEFMAFMIEVTLELAKLLNVDPYDQPAVENYKNSLHNS